MIAASLSGDVVVLTMVGALVIPVVLIVLAGELGKRFGSADGERGQALGPKAVYPRPLP